MIAVQPHGILSASWRLNQGAPATPLVRIASTRVNTTLAHAASPRTRACPPALHMAPPPRQRRHAVASTHPPMSQEWSL